MVDGSNNKIRVLVAEDESMIQLAYRSLFRKLDFNMHLAKNGRQAIQMAQTKYDLIFVDIGLPDINGLEVIKAIRARVEEKINPTPMVVVSAHHQESIQAACSNYDVSFCLTKPVTRSQLIDVIRACKLKVAWQVI